MATRQVTGATRGFVRTALLVSLFGAAYLAWLLSDVGSPRAEVVVSELVFVAARCTPPGPAGEHTAVADATHTAWWWLTVGCLTWAVGSVAFATYQVLFGRCPRSRRWPTSGYVGYAVPVALGIMRFPRTPGSLWSRWRSGLDSVVIAGCLLLTMSLLVLDPILDDATVATPARMVALAYPLVDGLVSSIVLARCVVLPDVRRMVWIR